MKKECFRNWASFESRTIPLMPPRNRILTHLKDNQHRPEIQNFPLTFTVNTDTVASQSIYQAVPQNVSLPYDSINVMKAGFLISLILQKSCSQCGTVISPSKQRFTVRRGPAANTPALYSGSNGFKPRSRKHIHTSRSSLFDISR